MPGFFFAPIFEQLDGMKYNLDPRFGVFTTINTNGCEQMPESIKSMFRNVTCVAPDIELISMVTLISDGFLDAKV